MSAADRKGWNSALSLYSLVLAGLLMANPAWADGIEWQDLDRDQQTTLNDFRDRWRDLPADQRERLIQRADRWRSLSDGQREAIQERWREIKPLPPEARDALRQRWETMSPDERREVVRDLRRQGGPEAGIQKSHQHD
ncbi:MAG: DUF3106 domain-containing protein [Perlucidibaca sp.]